VAAAELPPPSPWLLRHAATLRRAGGPVFDVACGRGRHALAVAAWGLATVGLDRDATRLGELLAAGRERSLPVHAVRAELETGQGLPLASSSAGTLLVFRYLFRPLASELERVLRPGGILLYQTFMLRQRELDHGPRNPAFLLSEGELPKLFPGLQVLGYREGLSPSGDRPAWLASLAARKPRRGVRGPSAHAPR
jgi:SAM-dependent methyltransferase